MSSTIAAMSPDNSMKALRTRDPSAGLRLETVPIPKIGPKDVLIKVAVAGLTTGVLKFARAGQSKTPMTVGHLGAGTVTAVGDEVTGIDVGHRVRVHPMLSCETCRYCTSGRDQMCQMAAIMGFGRFGIESALHDLYHDGTVAEYVRVPARLVDRIPDRVSLEAAAKVHDVATAAHALKLAKLEKGSVIVLTAPTGTMGVLTLRLARLYPIKKILLVGRSRDRLDKVRHLTSVPTEILAVEDRYGLSSSGEKNVQPDGALLHELLALSPEGIDAFIDYLPDHDLLPHILPALRTGGTFVHLGANPRTFPVPLAGLTAKCWTLIGTRANNRKDALECIDWMDRGLLKIDDLITHRFTLSNIEDSLKLLESRSQPMWLAVINVA